MHSARSSLFTKKPWVSTVVARILKGGDKIGGMANAVEQAYNLQWDFRWQWGIGLGPSPKWGLEVKLLVRSGSRDEFGGGGRS